MWESHNQTLSIGLICKQENYDSGFTTVNDRKANAKGYRFQSHGPRSTADSGRFAMGNTEEALKWCVLGTRQRAVPAAGPFDHKTGTGYVKAHRGDYADAICNRKARVKLLCHEIFGGMSSYAARHLRRLARDAARGGADATDYTLSATARRSCRSTRSASPRTS